MPKFRFNQKAFWILFLTLLLHLGATRPVLADGEFDDAELEKHYPREGNSELYQSDLKVPFSAEEGLASAKALANDQQAVLDDVFFLASKLDEKRESILHELGLKRIEALNLANAMPEANQLQRARKQLKLQQLTVGEFTSMDFNSPSDQIKIGKMVYDQYAIKGEKIDELSVVIPGVGRAEPTSIDRIVLSRIVHEKTGIAFLLLDNEISFDSKHLQQYIARVRYESNYGRGRPVVLLSYNHSPIEDAGQTSIKYKFYDTPKTWREKTKLWFQAKYVAPDRGAAIVAAMSVLFQVGTTEGITAVQYALGNIHEWSHTASALSAVYGTVFGLWGSFYYNITKPTNPHDRMSRNISVAKRMIMSSATFAWNLQILNHGLHSVSFYTVGGLSKNLAIASNTITNNAIKDEHILFTDIREKMGLSRGTVEILGTKIKKTQIERQAVYQLSFVLKIGDLVGLSVLGVPVGSALFYSSYVWSQYLVMKYAQSVNYRHTDEIVKKWKQLISFPARIVSAPDRLVSELGYALMVQTPKQLIQTAWAMAKDTVISTCSKLASSFKSGATGSENSPAQLPFTPSADGEWIELAH
jgi:hypothetical protein